MIYHQNMESYSVPVFRWTTSTSSGGTCYYNMRAEMVLGLPRGSPWNVLILPRVRLSITMVWDLAVEGTRAHQGAMVGDEINFNTTDKVTSQFDFSDKAGWKRNRN